MSEWHSRSRNWSWLLTPSRITAIYVVLGILWITSSDRLAAALVSSQNALNQVQTAKGWVFVLASGALIFGLTSVYHRAMMDEQEKLRSTGEKLQVLNRILRHNIRNQMNIIIGNAETAHQNPASDDETDRCLDQIEQTAERTVELAQKARRIDSLSLSAESGPTDLTAVVDEVVRKLGREYPEATIVVDIPKSVYIATNGASKIAISEIIENAIEHNSLPIEEREVHISSSMTLLSTVELTIEDNGPGIPDREIEPLLDGEETPLEHTSAIGLWLAKWALDHMDGDLSVDTDPGEGTRVTMTLPRQPLSSVTSKIGVPGD
jgi:signal transduction histidine kinase